MHEMLLYAKEHKINDKIKVKIPTVREIVRDEDAYYINVASIVSTPYDMMVQLADCKIDFTTITDWDLFCLTFRDLKTRDLSLIFGDLDFSGFETAVNQQNGDIILIDSASGIIIDKNIHAQICKFLRQILKLERHEKIPANKEAKEYMIERARKKQARERKKAKRSQLEEYIIALVNTPEFHYDYQSVLDLTIYQFNCSLMQIIKKVKFDNLMIGCYAGTVDMKTIDQSELTWIES